MARFIDYTDYHKVKRDVIDLRDALGACSIYLPNGAVLDLHVTEIVRDIDCDGTIDYEIHAFPILYPPKRTTALRTVSGIKEVIFNEPATIIKWSDGTKTVVRAQDDEPFDPEKGLAMAVVKKLYGNKGNYYTKFRKILKDAIHQKKKEKK